MDNRALAQFLLGEKDIRPAYETDHRSLLFPGKLSGYNNAFSYAVPGILGGGAWDTMSDIVAGKPVSTDEIKHSANEAAGAAMLGSMPMGAARGGVSLGSGGGRAISSAPARELDNLGYYSQALEAAKSWPQTKGTPEQVLTWLKKSGTKDAEIEATKLAEALSGKSAVTRDEVVKHLADNRVGLNEAIKPSGAVVMDRLSMEKYGVPSAELSAAQRSTLIREKHQGPLAQWQDYSLDPSNPTYLETVLHLPTQRRMPFDQYRQAYRERFPSANDVLDAEVRGFYDRGVEIPGAGQTITQKPDIAFQSGHFNEPNIIGHMMTSLNKHEGKPVFTLDQIQSDWGQRLRDGGLRDEAKIAGIRDQLNEAARQAEAKRATMIGSIGKDMSEFVSIHAPHYGPLTNKGHQPIPPSDLNNLFSAMDRVNYNGREFSTEAWTKYKQMYPRIQEAKAQWNFGSKTPDQHRLEAELRTAEAATPGHPLVNTTDQWTNTTLRRALQQAVEADAEHIAIPHGNTVLSYNPGDAHGMNAFYGDIVPKNLAHILGKLDKAGVNRRIVDQLETPSGMKGQGFTVFDLTPKMREEALRGLPLFVNPPSAALAGLLMQQYPQE